MNKQPVIKDLTVDDLSQEKPHSPVPLCHQQSLFPAADRPFYGPVHGRIKFFDAYRFYEIVDGVHVKSLKHILTKRRDKDDLT
jgi:hypothetical protein